MKNESIFIYKGCHSSEVTQLRFHPTYTNKLFSGSVDGLLCTFDISLGNENKALEQVYPIEDTISKIGVFGPSNEFLYCYTTFSNFYIISIEKEEIIADYKDIRNILSTIGGITINYLLECQYNPATNQFFIVSGTYSGIVVIFEIKNGNIEPYAILSEGHKSQIRCMNWEYSTNKIITGGEDSKLCLWNFSNSMETDNRSNLKITREVTSNSQPY